MANIINILQYLKCYLVLSGFLVLRYFVDEAFSGAIWIKLWAWEKLNERVNFHKWTLDLLQSETAWASGQRFPSVMKNSTYTPLCVSANYEFFIAVSVQVVFELNDSRSRIAGRCSAVETVEGDMKNHQSSNLKNHITSSSLRADINLSNKHCIVLCWRKGS